MAISQVLQGSSNSGTGQTNSPGSQLNMTEFLQLLTTQLSQQDPLDPMSDTEFFAQLAQMGTVQGVDGIQQSMQIAQASSLMGKTVTGLTTNVYGASVPVTGTVVQLTIQNGQYLLNVQDSSGNISQVNMNTLESVSSS